MKNRSFFQRIGEEEKVSATGLAKQQTVLLYFRLENVFKRRARRKRA
jgi:hypothetical protein